MEGEATGILLDNTEGITITGNMFAGMHRQAIEQIGSIDHLVITGNVMMDGSRENPGEYPSVDLEGEADVMESNSVEGQ